MEWEKSTLIGWIKSLIQNFVKKAEPKRDYNNEDTSPNTSMNNICLNFWNEVFLFILFK